MNFEMPNLSQKNEKQENPAEVEPKKKANQSKFMRTVEAGLAGAMILGAAGCENKEARETRPVDEVKHSETNKAQNKDEWITTANPDSLLNVYLKHKIGWGGRMKVNEGYEQVFKQSLDSYFAHINAGATPTRQETEARAEDLARKAGYTNRQLSILCKNGVPAEIKVSGKPVPLQPEQYSATELEAINHSN